MSIWRGGPNALAVQGLSGEVVVGYVNVTQYAWGGEGVAPVLKDVNLHFYVSYGTACMCAYGGYG